MADERSFDIDRLPTLTEVLTLGREWPAARESVPSVAAAVPRLDEAAVVERVLALLLPRIDGLLEARVSDALAPAVARAADALIREARAELPLALKALVSESLAQVLRDNDGRDQRN